jgi:flagellar protein FlaG
MKMDINRVSSAVSDAVSSPARDVPVQAKVQANAQANATAQVTSAPSSAQIQQALHNLKQAIEPVANDLSFSVDEQSGKTVIRVMDSVTKELIRQIPSEEVMAMAHAVEQQSGMLVQAKA